MKGSKFLLIFFILVGGLCAHRINVFAYQKKDSVYLQGYYSDGTKVIGGVVTVYDKNGNKLYEGKTDKKGELSLPISKTGELKIVLDAGGGHLAETTIRVESTSSRPKPARKAPAKSSSKPSTKKGCNGDYLTGPDVERIVTDVTDRQFRTLLSAIEEMKTRIYFHEVVGGIGYILGLMGIVLYFMSRRRR